VRRSFVIIVSLFVVLVGGISLYVRSDHFSSRLTEEVRARLDEATGSTVSVGKVGASFLPLFIEVKDVSLQDDQGVPAGTIRKVRAYINPIPLVVGTISIPRLTFLEPRITARRTAQGRIPLQELIIRMQKKAGAATTAGPPRFRVVMKTAVIQKGRILFIDELSTSTYEMMNVNARAAVDPEAGSVHLQLRNADARITTGGGSVRTGTIKTDLAVSEGKVTLSFLEVMTGDVRFQASGTAALGGDGKLDLKGQLRIGALTVDKLLSKLRGVEQEPALEAFVEVTGTPQDPAVSGKVQFPQYGFGDLSLRDATMTLAYQSKAAVISGKGWKLFRRARQPLATGLEGGLTYREKGFDISEVRLSLEDMDLLLSGRIDVARGYDMALSLESTGEGKGLGFLTKDIVQGAAQVRGILEGPLVAPRFHGRLHAPSIMVRGQKFVISNGGVNYAERKLILSDVAVEQGTSRYVVDGSIAMVDGKPFFDARARVAHSDVLGIVSVFYRHPLPLLLSVSGEIIFTGTTSEYSASAYLGLEKGSAYGETFDRASVSVTLVPGKVSFPKVLVYKGSGLVQAQGWIGFDKTFSANLESRFVDLSEVQLLGAYKVAGPFKLDMSASGSFSRADVTARVEVQELRHLGAALGSVAVQADLRDRKLSYQGSLGGERAAFSGSVGLSAPHPWEARSQFNLEGIDPFVILGKEERIARARVTVAGRIEFQGQAGDLSRLKGSASFQRLAVAIGDYRIDNEGEPGIEVMNGKLSFSEFSFSGKGTRFSITGGAKDVDALDITFLGSMHLSLLRLLYKEVEHGDGVAEVALTLTNEWRNPDVRGELLIKNGELKIKDLPQKFTALNGKIGFDREVILVDSVTGVMGGGKLDLSGWAKLNGIALRDFSAQVAFENVTARYPEGLTTTLSGGLAYDGNVSEQVLSGDVVIMRARYEKRVEWKTMLLDMARGFSQKRKVDVGWIGDTQLNIRFHGRENIILQNNLAKIPFEVDVFLRGTVGQPQVLGRVETNKGLVYFRRNDFNILHASVDFIDPNRMNPVLDVQAETRVREYQLRLALSGTAERSTLSLISEPPLSEVDILSLLALGKTAEEMTGRETSVGMTEAASFATGQFQDIFERRARSLTGLDRFQVDPYAGKGDTSVPRVTVGKEVIQDRLYLTYSSNVGTPTAEQVFRIEYILDRNFSLIGERNELGYIGADIKFRFEFK